MAVCVCVFAEINAGAQISFENSQGVGAGLIHPRQQGSKASVAGVQQSGTSDHWEDPPVSHTLIQISQNAVEREMMELWAAASAPRHAADQRSAGERHQHDVGGGFWPTDCWPPRLSLRLTFVRRLEGTSVI